MHYPLLPIAIVPEDAKPAARYIMTISVNDAFGQAWFSCFDDVGKMIIGMSADELQGLKEKSENELDNKAYEACFTEALCKTFIFRCRAKQDTYNDQVRIRYQVMSAAPMNFAAEANRLAEQIKLYSL
jgi:replication factor A1